MGQFGLSAGVISVIVSSTFRHIEGRKCRYVYAKTQRHFFMVWVLSLGREM